MVESAQSIQLNYSFCNDILSIYHNENTYNPFINPTLHPRTMRNFNTKNQSYKKVLIDSISNTWTAYHNQQSLNHSTQSSTQGCIFHTEFTTNADYLAASNHHNMIEFWDLDNRHLLKSCNFHKEIVTGIEFFNSNDITAFESEETNFPNDFMLSCSLDKTIKLSKNLKIIHEFTEHHDWIRCLSIDYSKKHFLSGCISSVIKYWDLEKRVVLLNIVNSEYNNETLNNVNCIKFYNNSDSVFASAFREGLIKLFDIRVNSKEPITAFKSHNNKLNTFKITNNNNYLLTSGRDSLGRLWDMRNLSCNKFDIDNSKVLTTYKGHKCSNYNIEISFINDENYIISGSENGKIYLYDTLTGTLLKVFTTEDRCVNLVKPVPNKRNKLSFIYAGLESLNIYYCEPLVVKKTEQLINDNKNIYNEVNKLEKSLFSNKPKSSTTLPQNDNAFGINMNGIMEEVLSESGDMILKIIHSNNINYSSEINYETLVETLQSSNDPRTLEVLNHINKKLQDKLIQHLQNKLCSVKEPVKSKDLINKMEDIKILCNLCKEDDDIISIPLNKNKT